MFLDLVRQRFSCRSYDPERPVPRELLSECMEAARLAPSACNSQPWRFVIVDEPEAVSKLRSCARLTGLPHPWWDKVPVFAVLCAEKSLVTHRIAPIVSRIPYHVMDLGIAGEHFVLAASERGLGTCWIGWFHVRRTRKCLGLPKTVSPYAMITVGYPEADLQPRDGSPQRHSIDDIIHWNTW